MAFQYEQGHQQTYLLLRLSLVSKKTNLQHLMMTASVIQKISTDVIPKVNVHKFHCNFIQIWVLYTILTDFGILSSSP